MTARSTTQFCARSLPGIAGSKLAGRRICVCCECCVCVCVRSFCNGPIPHRKESYQVCVCVCVSEVSATGRSLIERNPTKCVCMLEVSATSRSLIERNPTKCVCVCVSEVSATGRSLIKRNPNKCVCLCVRGFCNEPIPHILSVFFLFKMQFVS